MKAIYSGKSVATSPHETSPHHVDPTKSHYPEQHSFSHVDSWLGENPSHNTPRNSKNVSSSFRLRPETTPHFFSVNRRNHTHSYVMNALHQRCQFRWFPRSTVVDSTWTTFRRYHSLARFTNPNVQTTQHTHTPTCSMRHAIPTARRRHRSMNYMNYMNVSIDLDGTWDWSTLEHERHEHRPMTWLWLWTTSLEGTSTRPQSTSYVISTTSAVLTPCVIIQISRSTPLPQTVHNSTYMFIKQFFLVTFTPHSTEITFSSPQTHNSSKVLHLSTPHPTTSQPTYSQSKFRVTSFILLTN